MLGQISQLKTTLQEKKKEANELRAQLGESVSRKELTQAKGELRNVQLEAAAALKEVEAAREEGSKQQQQCVTLREAADKMRTAMADMVPRAKQLASLSEAKMAVEEVQLMKREVNALQDSLGKARKDNKELHSRVDELHASMAEMVHRSELSHAKADAKLWKDTAESSGAEVVELQKRVCLCVQKEPFKGPDSAQN